MKWIQTKDRLPTWEDQGEYNEVLTAVKSKYPEPRLKLLPFNLVSETFETHWASIDPPEGPEMTPRWTVSVCARWADSRDPEVLILTFAGDLPPTHQQIEFKVLKLNKPWRYLDLAGAQVEVINPPNPPTP